MCRLRQGWANTARGVARFLRETVGRVRYAGAVGQLTVRADSGCYNRAIVAACRKLSVRFSITARQHQSLRSIIEAIPEAEWTPILYWMEGVADVAETTYPFFQSEADHRRHAEIENAIGDLKYGVGLNHLPSGPFPANAAGLAVQVMAQNLARWTTRIGLGEPVATAKTPRRRFFSLAGRITRKARRLTLHLPQG